MGLSGVFVDGFKNGRLTFSLPHRAHFFPLSFSFFFLRSSGSGATDGAGFFAVLLAALVDGAAAAGSAGSLAPSASDAKVGRVAAEGACKLLLAQRLTAFDASGGASSAGGALVVGRLFALYFSVDAQGTFTRRDPNFFYFLTAFASRVASTMSQSALLFLFFLSNI